MNDFTEMDSAHALEAIERACAVWESCATPASEAYALIDAAVAAYIAAIEREKLK